MSNYPTTEAQREDYINELLDQIEQLRSIERQTYNHQEEIRHLEWCIEVEEMNHWESVTRIKSARAAAFSFADWLGDDEKEKPVEPAEKEKDTRDAVYDMWGIEV